MDVRLKAACLSLVKGLRDNPMLLEWLCSDEAVENLDRWADGERYFEKNLLFHVVQQVFVDAHSWLPMDSAPKYKAIILRGFSHSSDSAPLVGCGIWNDLTKGWTLMQFGAHANYPVDRPTGWQPFPPPEPTSDGFMGSLIVGGEW